MCTFPNYKQLSPNYWWWKYFREKIHVLITTAIGVRTKLSHIFISCAEYPSTLTASCLLQEHPRYFFLLHLTPLINDLTWFLNAVKWHNSFTSEIFQTDIRSLLIPWKYQHQALNNDKHLLISTSLNNNKSSTGTNKKQVVEVIWHKAASLPYMDSSVVFARWR